MFRIKICGVTSVADAQMAARAGADAIGLNFYSKSPRQIDPTTAATIVAAVPKEIVKVGVFVNATAEMVCELFDWLSLDLIQLHGDESPEILQALGKRPVMRAFRCGVASLADVNDYLVQCRKLGCTPDQILLDAYRADQYGGTGVTLDWAGLQRASMMFDLPPVVLAGGLKPENVGRAITTANPAAVDVAGGVECLPGVKDPQRVFDFVRAAREAFNQANRLKPI